MVVKAGFFQAPRARGETWIFPYSRHDAQGAPSWSDAADGLPGLHAEPDRARDARAAETTVAVRVLGEVLLVVLLGVIKLRCVEDLRGNRAVACLRDRLLV